MESAGAAKSDRPLESYLPSLESLLQEVLRHSGFELNFSIQKVPSPPTELESTEYVVEFKGRDADLLVEKNATLLNALEYVLLKAVRLEEEHFGRITFDCQDWRRMRAEELKLTAQIAAERVEETGDPFPLSPMNPRERRLVHLALKDRPKVRTASEGVGAERKVVILPATPPRRK